MKKNDMSAILGIVAILVAIYFAMYSYKVFSIIAIYSVIIFIKEYSKQKNTLNFLLIIISIALLISGLIGLIIGLS